MSSLESFSRQLGLLNQEWFIRTRLSIVGVGNLGSTFALMCAKVGFREIHLYDPDRIEVHNVSNQHYSPRAIGGNKSDKLAETLAFEAPSYYHFTSFKYHLGFTRAYQMMNSDIVIVLTDNIQSRMETFLMLLEYKKHNFDFKWFIEAGTHGKTAKIYIVDLDNESEVSSYFDKLLERHQAPSEELPCTERSTFFYANFVGSVIMNYLVKLSESNEVSFETWIDLANNEVMRFEAPPSDKIYSIEDMVKQYDPAGEVANLETIKMLETSGFNHKRFNWNELWNTLQDYGPSNDLQRLIFNLPKDLSRLTDMKDGILRIKLAKIESDNYNAGDCDRCPCRSCGNRMRCEPRPCGSKSSCMHDGYGRVYFCQHTDTNRIKKQFKFIWKIFRNKPIADHKETLSTFFKEWGDIDL